MLYGANTVKPDIHIQRFAERILDRKVSDIETLCLLEAAAANTGISLRDLDTTIWESSARMKAEVAD